MTLLELCNAIGDMAIEQKIINYAAAGTDINALNTQTIKDYPVCFVSPTGQHRVEENTTRYSLTLYYVERLLADSSNEMEILSVAVEQLKNLIIGIGGLDGVVGVDTNWMIQNFVATEDFADRLAGAYAQVEVIAVNDFRCFID